MIPALARVRVVLVRPSEPANVGAAARAMKNMGLRRLVVVDPPRDDEARATALAVHAADVLAARVTVASLADAVADCGLVVGTTGKPTAPANDGALPPRALAATILDAAVVNEVALVFGPEDHGLSNDELARCQQLVTIPTAGAYASLNLAQAVLLVGYELHLAAAARAGGGSSPAVAPRALATHTRQELLFAKLEPALRGIGFLQGDGATHVLRALRRALGRAALDDDEVQLLLGLARQIAWAAGQLPKRPPN